jgi:hypothetical protein
VCARKVLFGVWPEGHEARKHLVLMRARRHGGKQGTMTTMHPVEIPDGQCGWGWRLIALSGRPANDLHDPSL